jgi:hypothetical protein
MDQQTIEKRAKTILRAAAIKDAPVDLERVLAYLRLHHERPWHLSSDIWESLTREKRGRTRLTGQERRNTAGSRWKLAHEIGHHVIHSGEPMLRGSGQWERNELEHEADQFAAELLMPTALVEKAVDKDQPVDVEDLARAFKVGRQEMEKRLRQLGLLRKEIMRM